MITITQQPTSVTAIEWNNVIPSLTVIITGSLNDDEYTSSVFQWYKNPNTPITANTSSNLSSSVLTWATNLTESIGSYTCRITSGSGEVLGLTSSIATLAVQSVIKVQPAALSYSEWDSVNMSVVLTGSGQSGTVVYKWTRNGTAIAGGTAATLTSSVLANTPPNSYQVLIQSASFGKSSSLATISTINPLVTVQPTPSPAIIIEGNTFTATAILSSSIPVSYQWYRNGDTITDATTNTLTSPSGLWMPQLMGTYTLVGTTSSGSVTTNGINISVVPLGACAVPPVLWDQNTNQWYNGQ